MSLFNEVTGWMTRQKNKHDLGEGYEARLVNEMSNYELLEIISDALDKILKENKMIHKIRLYLTRRAIARWASHLNDLRRASLDINRTMFIIQDEQAKRQAHLKNLMRGNDHAS